MGAWSVPGYREVRELGSGGAGRVVLATYATTGAYVAIKYLRDDLREDTRFLAGFRQEARVMVELNDPNVVRLYEYVETRDGAAIVMELVDGVPLRRILAEHGTTSPEAALVVLKGSLVGLSAAHAAGIVHRDYKPENVLIQADGASKLSDFGIATPSGGLGTPAGTPPYMAPEQWDGSPASPATDVYAATCVFFECLTGHRPYRADHVVGLRRLHQSAPIPALDVPASVRTLVLRGLAKNPADRPSTARAFVADLESAATAAYGTDWEQRGRRHLAELATLLALTFPLAKPAEPVEVSTSLARTVLTGRLAHAAPRVALGTAVLSALVVAAVVAVNRQTPVAQDTLLTPPSHSATTPADTDPGAGVAGAGAGGGPEPSPAVSPTVDATSEAAAPPHASPGTGPHPSPATSPHANPGTPPAASPAASPTPRHVSPSPSRPAAPLKVTGLGVTRFDGQSATVRVGANTTARVLLTVRFAEGPAPDRLVAGDPQTIPLEGARSYEPEVQQAFPAPRCGTSVYRGIEAVTVPAAAGGTARRTVKVAGPPCPPPTVEDVEIDGWDGRAADVGVKTGGTGPVRVSAAFGRDGKTVATDTKTLSGKRSYSARFTRDLGPVDCGTTAVFEVRVTTDPPAAGGPRTRTVRVPGPACAPPSVSIASWDGASARVTVRASTTDPVALRVSFTQRLTADDRTTTNSGVAGDTLSGRTTYTATFSAAKFRRPECGFVDVRTVTVTASPGGSSASRTVTTRGPACPEQPPAEGPGDEPSEDPAGVPAGQQDGGGKSEGAETPAAPR
ncbi:serine/threonine-protein kinase [Microbispora oryzae]|uniref:serine/threonine-protein kinase n=1 Tax=Microbispora oryzae TaxID=2806554 RepID=UPI001E3B51D7|nr:serine/threonine-protein kinase [Microbispora oryzae]